MNVQPRPGILVTGASGFIGRKLVSRILEDQVRVRVLTRNEGGIPAEWKDKVEVWTGDLTNPATLLGIADGIETVYHLAGELRDRSRCDTVNRAGTQTLLAICQSAGVHRFLFLSSTGVMGARGARTRLDETTDAQPVGAYESSKYAGERAVLGSHQESGMQTTALRPSIVFGEGRKAQSDSFLSWVRAVNAKRFVQLRADSVSSYIYVGDVIGACLMLANHPESGGRAFIINEPVPLGSFVSDMANTLGVSPPPLLPRAVGAVPEKLLRLARRFGSLYNLTAFSMDRLASLGFVLPFGYQEGLRRTVAWYRDAGFLPSKPASAR